MKATAHIQSLFDEIKKQQQCSIQHASEVKQMALVEALQAAEQLRQAGLITMTETDDDIMLALSTTSAELNFNKQDAECLAAVQAALPEENTELTAEFEQFRDRIDRFIDSNESTTALSVIKSDRPTHYLHLLQEAVASSYVIYIAYHSIYSQEDSSRDIEPQALYLHPSDGWIVIAWCRLRNDFREFRLDRIEQLEVKSEHFDSRGFDLMEYFYKLLSPE